MLSFVDVNNWFSLLLAAGTSLMSEITTSLTLANFLLMDWLKGLVLSVSTWDVDGVLKIKSMHAAPSLLLAQNCTVEE
jgi:hypothetical protein